MGNEKLIRNRSFIWNAIGAGISSIQSAALLFVCSRYFSIEISSAITIAYTLANVFLAIAKYGLRSFQVSDENNEFVFADYFYARMLTTLLSVLLCAIYLAIMFSVDKYSLDRVFIISLLSVMKLIESIEDVYVGHYQFIGRLDIGAKYYSIHMIIETVLICLASYLTHNMFFSLVLGIVSSFIIVGVLIKNSNSFMNDNSSINLNKLSILLKIGFPLCLSTTLYLFFGNLPKYLSDFYFDDKKQVVIGYLMLPMFVILLFNNFIMQPLIKPLSKSWHLNNHTFNQMIKKHFSIIAIFSVVYIGIGASLFLPIMSYVYSIDLTPYISTFILLGIGIVIYTVCYYCSTLLTIMRKQNNVLYGYLLGLALILLLKDLIINQFDFIGICVLFILSNLLIMIYYFVILIKNIHNHQPHQ